MPSCPPHLGTWCTTYQVDGEKFRAVVDTGSPFLLVAGTADCANPDLDRTTGRGGLTLGTKWGCYRLGGPTRYNGVQGSLNDMSEERYGGQVRHCTFNFIAPHPIPTRSVTFRPGSQATNQPSPLLLPLGPLFSFIHPRPPHCTELQDSLVEWRRGFVKMGSRKNRGNSLEYEPIIFGVVRTYVARGGGGAIYLGLVKDRQPRIRPTFLEQTDVEALRFDFTENQNQGSKREPGTGSGASLTLSEAPLIPANADAVPLVDLRPLGAPLSNYAAKVLKLIVNGEEVKLNRPTVAILGELTIWRRPQFARSLARLPTRPPAHFPNPAPELSLPLLPLIIPDTGTTGLAITDTLYDTEELPLPGAAMRDIRIELEVRRATLPLALPLALAPSPTPRPHPYPACIQARPSPLTTQSPP